jgi:polysaccharide biosynthesis/export protein
MTAISRAQRRVFLPALLASIPFLFSACALPGIDIDTGDFEEVELPEDEVAELKPVLREITPGLVAQLQEQRAAREQASIEAVIDASYETEYSDYEIGPGDVLSVIVWDHPELTNPTNSNQGVEGAGRLVHADGTMFFPYVGSVNVAGRTVIEARRLIADGLSGVIREPQVDVNVIAYRSKHAFVVGNVGRPCRIAITNQPLTVIDALNKCESITRPIAAQTVRIIRGSQVTELDLEDIYLEGAAGPGIELRDGDRVFVEDDTWKRVFVVGEFTEQTALRIPTSGITLAESIAGAGGVNLETANADQIYVIRGLIDADVDHRGAVRANPQPFVYHLDASSAEAFILADQFPLNPRDVVFAPAAGLVDFNRAIGQLVPTVLLLAQGRFLFEGRN